MRKWSFILFCLTGLAGLMLLVGCDGDTGLTGGKGAKGRQGTGGYDPDGLAPAGRPFAFGVTNNTENGVSGRKQIYLSFDSTARGTKDTVVANRVSVPPLIDGKDDEEFEWGPQKSKISNMVKLDTNSSVLDYGLSRATVRAAYDDENIYMLFQWTETQFTAKGSKDTVEVVASESKLFSEVGCGIRAIDSIRTQWVKFYKPCSKKDSVRDTVFTYFRRVRTDKCLLPGADSCLCWSTDVTTRLVWKPSNDREDRLAVFFPDSPVQGWQDAAFQEFFGFASRDQTIPENLLVDAWAWGAATTRPVSSADDWNLTSNGVKPDIGQGTYLVNFSSQDSVPLYMNRRDPNLKTGRAGYQQTEIYPLWSFDAVGFALSGWDLAEYTVYVPGIVTTIPSESRADVYAAAAFDNGIWTVEMKRARKTHYGDDVQF